MRLGAGKLTTSLADMILSENGGRLIPSHPSDTGDDINHSP